MIETTVLRLRPPRQPSSGSRVNAAAAAANFEAASKRKADTAVSRPYGGRCKCSTRSGYACSLVRDNWALHAVPFRTRLKAVTEAERRTIVATCMSNPPAKADRRRRTKDCKRCTKSCEGHVEMARPQCQYHILASVPMRVCLNMFLSVVAGLLTPAAVKAVRGGMRHGRNMQAMPRGGANNVKDSAILSLLFEFVAGLPQELRHYALTAKVNRKKMVLRRGWLRSKIYWSFCKLHDPLYYAECRMLRQWKMCGYVVPPTFERRKPRIGVTRAYTYMRSLDMRIAKDHKDDCGACFEYDLYIKQGEDSNATAATRLRAGLAKASKAEHMRRADAACYLQAAEQDLCLRQTVAERKLEAERKLAPLVCKCGKVPFECACRFMTRAGYELMQQDKGAKLRLPDMPGIGVLFYFSHINMIFEHITAYSQRQKGQRTAYAWDELVATSGVNNMISVNYHYLCHHPSGRQGLVLWCDNCFKELKNWTVVAYCVYLVYIKKMFKWVVIRWYEKGHSKMGGMGPDSTQAKITLAGKDKIKVVARDYREIAAKAAAGQIEVVDCTTDMFRNWKVFLGQFFSMRQSRPNKETGEARHNVDSEGRRVDLRDFRWFRVDSDEHVGWVQGFTEMDASQQPVLMNVVRARPEKYHVASPMDVRLTLPVNQISYNQAKGLLNAYVYMNEDQRAHYKPQLERQDAIWDVGNTEKKQNFVKLRDKLMGGDVDPASEEYEELIMDPRDEGEFAGLESDESDDSDEPDEPDESDEEKQQLNRAEAQKASRKAKRDKLARVRKKKKQKRDGALKISLRESVRQEGLHADGGGQV